VSDRFLESQEKEEHFLNFSFQNSQHTNSMALQTCGRPKQTMRRNTTREKCVLSELLSIVMEIRF